MHLLGRNTRNAQHRATSPLPTLDRQIQRELREISQYCPIWGETLGYPRHQVHFLLLPEFWEQGLLRPSEAGYNYERIERIECADIYCKRFTDAMRARNRTHSTEANDSPPSAQYEISNQGDCVPGQAPPHSGSNSIQRLEMAPYAMTDLQYLQQLELYPTMSSLSENPDQTYYFTDSHSMDTSSDAASGLDFQSPPSTLWDLDLYNQVHSYGHWTNDSSPPPPRG